MAKNKFQAIKGTEARGDSQLVSGPQFQQIAAQGQQRLDTMAGSGHTRGFDPGRSEARENPGQTQHWDTIKAHAADAVSQSWGGATYSPRSGRAVRPMQGYAVTARTPGQQQIRLPENASHEQLGAAMDQARDDYPQLEHAGHYLGVFHDDEKKEVQVDPVVITHGKHAKENAHEIGAATRALGGAYNFATGNGTFPPHVRG
jgi:hypothetical protein